jgi:hypothetical protein
MVSIDVAHITEQVMSPNLGSSLIIILDMIFAKLYGLLPALFNYA